MNSQPLIPKAWHPDALPDDRTTPYDHSALDYIDDEGDAVVEVRMRQVNGRYELTLESFVEPEVIDVVLTNEFQQRTQEGYVSSQTRF